MDGLEQGIGDAMDQAWVLERVRFVKKTVTVLLKRDFTHPVSETLMHRKRMV